MLGPSAELTLMFWFFQSNFALLLRTSRLFRPVILAANQALNCSQLL